MLKISKRFEEIEETKVTLTGGQVIRASESIAWLAKVVFLIVAVLLLVMAPYANIYADIYEGLLQRDPLFVFLAIVFVSGTAASIFLLSYSLNFFVVVGDEGFIYHNWRRKIYRITYSSIRRYKSGASMIVYAEKGKFRFEKNLYQDPNSYYYLEAKVRQSVKKNGS